MPAKNSRKSYIENGYYHLYNRGVEKRVIFLDEQDYGVFLSYLKGYLIPKDAKGLSQKLSDPNSSPEDRAKVIRALQMNNFNKEITLLAYCLMPNHFHFFVKQKSPGTIYKFMNSLGTRYTMYFNKKYKRVGSLYQGVYKAVLIENEGQFLHLSRYIHRQAIALMNQPSSYPDYLGTRRTSWVHPEEILSYFSKTNPLLSYKEFVNTDETYSAQILGTLTLEELVL